VSTVSFAVVLCSHPNTHTCVSASPITEASDTSIIGSFPFILHIEMNIFIIKSYPSFLNRIKCVKVLSMFRATPFKIFI